MDQRDQPNGADAWKGFPRLEEVERTHVERALAAAGGNKTLAARILGIDRKTLGRRLNAYAQQRPRPA